MHDWALKSTFSLVSFTFSSIQVLKTEKRYWWGRGGGQKSAKKVSSTI